MSRIGAIGQLTNSQATILRRLQQIGTAIDQSTERLSTLRKVNRASDNPSGIGTIARLEAALLSNEGLEVGLNRAKALLTTADSAAGEIANHLSDARALILESAGGGLSASELAANQSTLDTILSSIDRSSQAEFNGRRLLDGSSGYRVNGQNTSQIATVEVLNKQSTDSVSVSVNVSTAAAKGALSYSGGALTADTTLTVTGSLGSATISIANGASTTTLAEAFNSVSHLTGVTASRISASQVDFSTTDYGSDAKMTFEVAEGALATTGTGIGTDAVATVNGTTVTGEGTKLAYNNGSTNLLIELEPAASGLLTSFTVSGSGLEFQNSHSAGQPARIGLQNLSSGVLGGSAGRLGSLASGGTNRLSSGNFAAALEIIDRAAEQVNGARAQIGGFQKYSIESPLRLLEIESGGATTVLEEIRDTSAAYETAVINRQHLLSEAAHQALIYTNLDAVSVLSVLRGGAS